ncbi:hypothetical protein SAMN05421640_1958 [Ekhidna lutea]|uniref:Uncharacterized protein n=1 Tax=Ekhidna lutea TaxID=447679 RepID=A0A239J4B3_EKHLU|nr:hypothetical protein [Ekhidna lutea]SNT00093.1 hypothetical protein SAMN05421640_1958 [Ekhidna lutea]
MPSYPVNHSLYVLLWNKYKPVILKLMKDAAEEPQEYQFIPHEFRDLNPKEKSGHSFTLEAHKRRAVNNIKMSVVAQDLLEILLKSNTALNLLEEATFEFKMDKQFKFVVTRHELETEETADEAVEAQSEVKEKEEA